MPTSLTTSGLLDDLLTGPRLLILTMYTRKELAKEREEGEKEERGKIKREEGREEGGKRET